jgi:hypothetical protein
MVALTNFVVYKLNPEEVNSLKKAGLTKTLFRQANIGWQILKWMG